MKSPKVTHAEFPNHPSNYKVFADRLFALCGKFYDAATEFEHVDKVTCPRCKELLKAREEMHV